MTHSKFISAFILLFTFSVGFAQSQFNAAPGDKNTIIIEGTSNIHDWEIKVEDFTSKLDLSQESESVKIGSINLTIPVKSLKSGKSKMDKNAYEAMEADSYEMISFNSTSSTLMKEVSPGVYQANVKGDLTISGTTKQVEIPLELHKSSAGYTLKAEKDLKMLDFGIEPPTALFGTITTGEIVNIIFNLTHYKS